jgi:cholesterol oxidase
LSAWTTCRAQKTAVARRALFDRPVAQASLAGLRNVLDHTDLVLFVGDQIYADATAGLMDPTRRDEQYDQPHDNALRAQAMREILRRVPVRMLLDDHELSDDWEPMALELQGRNEAAAKKINDARRFGYGAYRKYQQMQRARRRDPVSPPDGPVDVHFSFGGYRFYLADTRTGRSPRGSAVSAADVQILGAFQRDALEKWLLDHPHEVKFVATPSLLLPRLRATAESDMNRVRSDAWDGFPHSTQRLIEFIFDNKIRNTVFLSGDEHHSLFAEITIRPANAETPAIKLVSVHSSALYGPFPFANGRPQDLVEHETFRAGNLSVEVQTTFASPGDGFALLELSPGNGHPPVLSIKFMKGSKKYVGQAHRVKLG